METWFIALAAVATPTPSDTASQAVSDPSKWPLIGIAMLVGGVIGWIGSQLKTAAEITKLKSETANNIAKFLLEIQNKHDAYNRSCINCRQIADELVALISSNAPVAPVNDARSRFCAVFLEEVIINFHHWMEIETLRYKSEPKELEALLTDDFPSECRKFSNWLQTINDPNLLHHLARNPASIDHSWLKPFYRLSTYLRGARRKRVDQIIKREVEQIIKAGHAEGA